MDFDINDGLYVLCARTDICLNEIEEYIDEHALSAERITYIAIMLVEMFSSEEQDFMLQHERNPMPYELVSRNFVELFNLFIAKGLDPNMIIRKGDSMWYNVMEELFYVRNRKISLPILKKLLEIGGDPNLMLDDETLFDRVDFDVVFGVVEQEDVLVVAFRLWRQIVQRTHPHNDEKRLHLRRVQGL